MARRSIRRLVWVLTGQSGFEGVFTSIRDAALAGDEHMRDYGEREGVNRWNPTRSLPPASRIDGYWVGRWTHDWGRQFTVGEHFYIRATYLYPRGGIEGARAVVLTPHLEEAAIDVMESEIMSAQRARASQELARRAGA